MRQADDLTAAEAQQWADTYTMAVRLPSCMAVVQTLHSGIRYKFTCTREASHVGPHVAHVPGGSVAAVWMTDDCKDLG